jgi:pimeloyl-ACP methyl ester carboxylesterase
VLIHGLSLRPANGGKPDRAVSRSWQQPGSPLVQRLARDADVFAFAYGQTVPVEEVARASALTARLRDLRRLGYRELVLVGHSAGALVARHLVEDHPDLGVTKVVQVCAPNGGSSLAKLPAAGPGQAAFLASLTKPARAKVLHQRADKRVPAAVEFVVVVATSRLGGDGVLRASSQWPEDLQKQGIPAVMLRATHWEATRGGRGIDLIARLVGAPQPRWGPAEVAAARKLLFGARPASAPEGSP